MNKIALIETVLQKADSYIDESNTTSNGGEYNTKFAFNGEDEESENARTEQGDKSSGFPNKTDRGNMNFEVLDKWESEIISELKVKDLKSASASGKKEMNKCVDTIYSHIYQIDKCLDVMKRHMKSKNLKANNIWKSKSAKVHKIDKILNKLSRKFKETIY